VRHAMPNATPNLRRIKVRLIGCFLAGDLVDGLGKALDVAAGDASD